LLISIFLIVIALFIKAYSDIVVVQLASAHARRGDHTRERRKYETIKRCGRLRREVVGTRTGGRVVEQREQSAALISR
jgi:hypothetical protein